MVGSTYEPGMASPSPRLETASERVRAQTATLAGSEQRDVFDHVAQVFDRVATLATRVEALVDALVGDGVEVAQKDPRTLDGPRGALPRLEAMAHGIDYRISRAHDELSRLDNVIGRG